MSDKKLVEFLDDFIPEYQRLLKRFPIYEFGDVQRVYHVHSLTAIKERLEGKKIIECPFCGEDDFDKIGLKIHLTRYCEEYDATPMEDEK